MRLKIFRKIASASLALLLVCGCFAVSSASSLPTMTANAEESENGFRFIANSTNKTAIVTGYSGVTLKLSIPSYLDGYKVVSLQSDAFKGMNALTSVSIPDTVTAIGSGCFSGCTLLSTVSLGNGVFSIGAKAFENCKALSTIQLPKSLSVLGAEVFVGCTALSRIEVSESNLAFTSKDGLLFNKAGTTLIQYPAFHPGTAYNVPDTVTKIENYAFAGNKILSIIYIPSKVSSIGKGAFKDCIGLTEIQLPADLSKIEDDLFNGCKKLSKLNMPKSVTTIGASAFANCTSIPALKIPDTITLVGNEAFSGCTALSKVTVGAKVTAITGSAFRNCTALKSFDVVEGGNFSSSDGVLFNKDRTRLIAYPAAKDGESYTVPSTVATIGDYAFDHCVYLKKLIVPSTVKLLVRPVITACASTYVYVDNSSQAMTYFQANTSGIAGVKIGRDVLSGDVNGDGKVDNADMIILCRYDANWKNITVDKDASDVNKDGKVDSADVIILCRYLAGWKNITLK